MLYYFTCQKFKTNYKNLITMIKKTPIKTNFYKATANEIARDIAKSMLRDGRFQSYLSMDGPAWLHDLIARETTRSNYWFLLLNAIVLFFPLCYKALLQLKFTFSWSIQTLKKQFLQILVFGCFAAFWFFSDHINFCLNNKINFWC